MMTLQGPASKMTGSDAHPWLKVRNVPASVLARSQKYRGWLEVLIPIPAFCLLSSPFTLLNEHHCLEDTREDVIKTDRSLNSSGWVNWIDKPTPNTSNKKYFVSPYRRAATVTTVLGTTNRLYRNSVCFLSLKITCDPIIKLLSKYLSIYSSVVCGNSFFTSVRQWIKLLAWGDLGGNWLFIVYNLVLPHLLRYAHPRPKKKPQLLTKTVLTAFFHIPSWELQSIGIRMLSI